MRKKLKREVMKKRLMQRIKLAEKKAKRREIIFRKFDKPPSPALVDMFEEILRGLIHQDIIFRDFSGMKPPNPLVVAKLEADLAKHERRNITFRRFV
jgi:hypothetical protein